MWNRRWKPIVFVALIAAAVGAVVVEARDRGYLQRPDLWGYDILTNARRYFDKGSAAAPPTPVVVVGMTEGDIAKLHYPVSDELMALLLEKILVAGPRCVGIDIYRDQAVGVGREHLDRVLLANRNVVVIMKAAESSEIGADDDDDDEGGEGGEGVAPPAVLRNRREQIADNGVVEDPDGTVRRALWFFDIKDPDHPDGDDLELDTLAFSLATKYLGREAIPIELSPDKQGRPHLGQMPLLPLEKTDGGYALRERDVRGYQFLMDFRTPALLQVGHRKPSPFPLWRFSQVLDNKAPPQAFKDKVVLIGMTAPSVKDYFNTPVRKNVFGVVVHGYVVDQLIRGALHGDAAITYWTDSQEALWILLWSAVGAVIGSLVRSPLRLGVLTATAMLVLIAAAAAEFRGGVWVPLVPPALAMLVTAAGATSFMVYLEGEQRAAVMQLFSRHVSHDFARIIWERRDELLQGGRLRPEKLIATVLFTDLRGFTHVSEVMDPGAVMSWLNDYMEHMSRIVKENEGVVAKYVGDAVMAVFGVPVARDQSDGIEIDAANAVRCALQMREQLRQLNQRWAASSMPTIGMRVGIHTGVLVSGSFGGKDRLEFTVIGNTVNTASRLESYDKSVMDPDIAANDCRILVSQDTLNRLGGRFGTRFVGDVKLSGMVSSIAIYGVLNYASENQVSGGPEPSKTAEPAAAAAEGSPGNTN